MTVYETTEEFLAALDDIADTPWMKVKRALFYNPRRTGKLMRRAPKRWVQRARRGHADEDVWNMGGYVARVLTEMVVDMQACMHGYPADLTEQEWFHLLCVMERGFMAAEFIFEGESNDPADYERERRHFEEGMRVFTERFFDLWD